MARGKRAERELTPEEKLEQALVPTWEQPYKVPENWCWTYWGNVGGFTAGSGFKNEYQGFTGYQIPFYKVGSLKYSDKNGFLYDNSNTISEEIRAKLKATLIPSQSIIFAKIGEAIRLNRRSINSVPCCIDNNLMAFQAKRCFWRYVFYWTLGLDLYTYTNATTVPAIRKSDLETIPFPFPPLPEQHRIVSRIESLFAKLDEAKERAQAVVDGFELRKSAILHKAFTGDLTESWRAQHQIEHSTWKLCCLNDVANWGSGGTPSRKFPEYYTGNIPWVKTGELNNDYIYDTEEHISQSALENSSAKLYPKKTVLIAMYGATIGQCGILEIEAATNQACACAIAKPETNHKFLFYYLLSQKNEFIRLGKGGAQPNISQTVIKQHCIMLPTLLEQQEIVGLLDHVFKEESQAKETAEAVLTQIDAMKKAILARAFRGELGTNDPAEESAVELVRQVLEKSNEIIRKPKATVTRVVIPAEIKSALSNANEEKIIRAIVKSAPEAVPLQTIMSISKKKFELMDALRSLEEKQIIIRTDTGEYLLTR